MLIPIARSKNLNLFTCNNTSIPEYKYSIDYAENFSFPLRGQLVKNPRGSYSTGTNLNLSMSNWHYFLKPHTIVQFQGWC